MQKSKTYLNAKFSVDTIKQAILTLEAAENKKFRVGLSIIYVNGERWSHDDIANFYEDYRKSDGHYYLQLRSENSGLFTLEGSNREATVSVTSSSRTIIQDIFSQFEDRLSEATIASIEDKEEKILEIFIGHGRSALWRDLKDHLQDKHGYKVSAYETGARAGHVIRDIIDELATKASMAFLVFTAEDEQADGSFHARQNVVHETGLFQGRLGFARAIVLLEEGAEPFSNCKESTKFVSQKETLKRPMERCLQLSNAK